jgi:hypothetical protein
MKASSESPSEAAARKALQKFTLGRLREQFGAALELTVVQLDGGALNVHSDFGPGVVNTVIAGMMAEGQDWAMYQEGLMEAWDRLSQFDWVLLLNDQMVGPIVHLPTTLQLAEGAGMWAASTMPPCCVRGFALAFSRALIATQSWRQYWERIAWPCAKVGPMVIGENGITKLAETQWHNLAGGCATSTQFAIGKGQLLSLQRSRAPTAPFLYRWGVQQEFMAQGDERGIELALQYLNDTRVASHVESCGVSGEAPFEVRDQERLDSNESAILLKPDSFFEPPEI